MSDNKMDNEIKEFYVKRVKKHNEQLKNSNKSITLGYISLGLMGIYIPLAIANSETYIVGTIPFSYFNFVMAFVGGSSLTNLIKDIKQKTGLNVEIDEIRDYFAQYGLVLNDEVSKSRSR